MQALAAVRPAAARSAPLRLEPVHARHPLRASFEQFIAARYAQADVVVCRAGAMTVAELAAAGVPGVLVPYPHAVDDHQTANARFLVAQGAALLLPQSELTPQRLAELLGGLDRARLLEMARAARALGKPEAARVVAERCRELAR